MNEANKNKFSVLSSELKELSEFAKKPNDIIERIESGDKQNFDILKRELSLL
jgi:hypothetical protein